MNGTIKKITDKGFGFIAAEGTEYFFHRSGCVNFDGLKEGDKVTFEEGEAKQGKGPRAEKVKKA